MDQMQAGLNALVLNKPYSAQEYLSGKWTENV